MLRVEKEVFAYTLLQEDDTPCDFYCLSPHHRRTLSPLFDKH
jgi:hypothetical protein